MGGNCCPSCGFGIEPGQEDCPSCGVVFSRMRAGGSVDGSAPADDAPGSFDPSMFGGADTAQVHESFPELDTAYHEPETVEPEFRRDRAPDDSASWLLKATVSFIVLAVGGVLTVLGIGGSDTLREVPSEDRVTTDLRLIESAVWGHVRSARPFPDNQRITDLARLLNAQIPTHDPWGGEYRYELAGFSSFRVGSAGPDGEWTHGRLASYENGANMGDDIVTEHGTFLRPD